ncbi:MAG: hypothetical protein QOI42_197, partial [Frankiaceae bacterium]|nr:hypothetical protein [Frankiaceae bacterium]
MSKSHSSAISKKSLVALALLALTACGGKAAVATTQQPTAADSGAAQSGGAQPGGGRQAPPGVSGLVAAISGKTLQVQSTTSQTAVTYSSTTALTQSVPATSSDVAVGLCALVREAQTGASTTPGAQPATAVTATTVQLSQPVNGACAAAGGAAG